MIARVPIRRHEEIAQLAERIGPRASRNVSQAAVVDCRLEVRRIHGIRPGRRLRRAWRSRFCPADRYRRETQHECRQCAEPCIGRDMQT